jgi:bacitracin transport system permease protein
MLFASILMPLIGIFYFGASNAAEIDPTQFYKLTAFSYTPWIILPLILGMLCTMLMYDENQNDMLKQLWIVPVSKMGYFFSKFTVVLIYSLCFMLLAAVSSILTGVLSATISFTVDSVSFLFIKCLEIGVLSPFAILPVLAVATSQKGYILPVCVTIVYTFLGFILLMVNMYTHPLSSMTAILMRNVPGVVMKEPLYLGKAFLCIGIWGTASIIWANIALAKRK